MTVRYRTARSMKDLRHAVTGWELLVWDDYDERPTVKSVLYNDGVGYWAFPDVPSQGCGYGIECGEDNGTGYSADDGREGRWSYS